MIIPISLFVGIRLSKMTIQLRDIVADQIHVRPFWSDLRTFAKLSVEIFNQLNPTLELHSGYFLLTKYAKLLVISTMKSNSQWKKESEEHLYFS